MFPSPSVSVAARFGWPNECQHRERIGSRVCMLWYPVSTDNISMAWKVKTNKDGEQDKGESCSARRAVQGLGRGAQGGCRDLGREPEGPVAVEGAETSWRERES